MTSELRLLYMAMSRARSRLYLSYSGRLPPAYDVLRKQNLADFLE
jgi:superfamily I DNA/RNA helicase